MSSGKKKLNQEVSIRDKREKMLNKFCFLVEEGISSRGKWHRCKLESNKGRYRYMAHFYKEEREKRA